MSISIHIRNSVVLLSTAVLLVACESGASKEEIAACKSLISNNSVFQPQDMQYTSSGSDVIN